MLGEFGFAFGVDQSDWHHTLLFISSSYRCERTCHEELSLHFFAVLTWIYIVSIFMAYSRSATMEGPDPSVVIFNTSLFCSSSPLHLTYPSPMPARSSTNCSNSSACC